MTFDMNPGIEFLRSIFVDVTVFSMDWILSLIIVLILLILISRDAQEWKVLAFPVTVIVHIIGIKPSFIWYTITVVMFSMEVFNNSMMGNVVRVFSKENKKGVRTNTDYNKAMNSILSDVKNSKLARPIKNVKHVLPAMFRSKK